MVILYTLQDNNFIDISNLKKNHDGSFTNNIYVNLTNKCPCACTFCLRSTKQMMTENSLWLENEPSYKQIIEEFDNTNIDNCREIIFCGFGEPLERVETVIKVAKYLKERKLDISIRINTNGLGNLIHGKDITKCLKGVVDTISISLNASTKEKYLELTRNRFGLMSFDAMLEFAVKCKDSVPHVILSVVDVIGEEEIKACRKICEEISVEFRVRAFE